MKRSVINDILVQADAFIRSFGFVLPPFAYWSPKEMLDRKTEIAGILNGRLGWDVTDFGQGRFDDLGLFLFTVRNGRLADLARGGGMCYAEKIMISRQNQDAPMHRHPVKAEDIINRGGATLALKLFNSKADGTIDPSADVTVATDGLLRTQGPGEILRLEPGESVTLMPGLWHACWGDGGDVLIGEVSTVNDDWDDNVFDEPIGRFAEIEEDAEPTHLLVSDYDKWIGPA